MKTKMKNYVLALIAVISISSCNQIEDAINSLIKIEPEYDKNFTISPVLVNGKDTFDETSPDIQTDIKAKLAEKKASTDNIKEITLTSVICKITNPSSGDFKFIKSISVYIIAAGQDEFKMASLSDVSDTVGNEIELDVNSDKDLLDFLSQESIQLRVVLDLDEDISEEYTLNVATKFDVDVEL